jgi:hypothetical protein
MISTTSKFHTIAIFKSFVENYSSKTYTYVHNLPLYWTSFKCSDSWPVSIKQNMNLTFNSPVRLYFLSLLLIFLLKVLHSLKIYHNTKCYDPTLTGASFVSTSEVWTPAILVWLKLQVWRSDHFQCHDIPTQFYRSLWICLKVIRGSYKRTDRQNGDLINLTVQLMEGD